MTHLKERRKWRQMIPLLAEPGIRVTCLEDGAQGTSLAATTLAGQLAYRVHLEGEIGQTLLATNVDVIPRQDFP